MKPREDWLEHHFRVNLGVYRWMSVAVIIAGLLSLSVHFHLLRSEVGFPLWAAALVGGYIYFVRGISRSRH